MTKRLFVDMDGVLANFHDEENFTERMYEKGFFTRLSPFKNAVETVKKFNKNPDFEVFIISSSLNETARKEKNRWLDWHLPGIPNSHRIFPEYGRSKAEYVGTLNKTDILCDDYNVNLRDWHKSGGTAILCVNNTSHLRPKGMQWSGASVENGGECEEIVANLTNSIEQSLTEQTVILRLYNPVYPQYYSKNHSGELAEYPYELATSEIVDQLETMNEIMENYDNDMSERGLMEYFHCGDESIEKSVDSKVKSINQHFEIVGDEVMFITECEVKEELTASELEELKSHISGQNADGLGESFEQKDIKMRSGVLNVSVWSGDSDYEILTEEEFAHKFGMDYTPPTYPQNQPKKMITERFYTPITPHVFDPLNLKQELSSRGIKNKIGDAEALAKILNTNCTPICLTEHFNDVFTKNETINSLNQHYEVDSGDIILVTEYEATEELSASEQKNLTEYLLDQMSDAYGEGVMKRDCDVRGINVPVQIFGDTSSYELLTKSELGQHHEQEIAEEMGMTMA